MDRIRLVRGQTDVVFFCLFGKEVLDLLDLVVFSLDRWEHFSRVLLRSRSFALMRFPLFPRVLLRSVVFDVLSALAKQVACVEMIIISIISL